MNVALQSLSSVGSLERLLIFKRIKGWKLRCPLILPVSTHPNAWQSQQTDWRTRMGKGGGGYQHWWFRHWNNHVVNLSCVRMCWIQSVSENLCHIPPAGDIAPPCAQTHFVPLHSYRGQNVEGNRACRS